VVKRDAAKARKKILAGDQFSLRNSRPIDQLRYTALAGPDRYIGEVPPKLSDQFVLSGLLEKAIATHDAPESAKLPPFCHLCDKRNHEFAANEKLPLKACDKWLMQESRNVKNSRRESVLRGWIA
jgi:hypothetical protein